MANPTVLDQFMKLPTPADVTIVTYVWIGGTGLDVRAKSKTVVGDASLESLPIWNFDGSSTGQATGEDSEVLLKPVAMFDDPFMGAPHKLVMSECLHPRTQEPIPGANRSFAVEQFEAAPKEEPWFGIEQEYFLVEPGTDNPYGWPKAGFPAPQGPYYCSAGAGFAVGRDIADAHYRACLYAGIKISGTNAEVAPSQWEFQVGPCVGIEEGDHLWMARYLLLRVAERFDVGISFSPKPRKGDWNGSGAHCNYSTAAMRADGGLAVIEAAVEKLSLKHAEHIAVYGENADRLTGLHETCNINEFKSGVANRAASIRIGNDTANAGKGYMEDRRPASDCDPYLVTGMIFKTTVVDDL